MWWSGLSGRRRLLFGAAGTVLVLVAVLVGVLLFWADGERPAPEQDRLGPVILVPGYGGSQDALRVLAGRIQESGRDTHIVTLPGDGTGDLLAQVAVLDRDIDAALDGGAPSVDVIGYSAGGLVARLWLARERGELRARRVITMGSPLHGTRLAASGSAVDVCPTACQQLAPGSALLASVERAPVPVPWLSIWTENDRTVIPPDSARLDGAENLALQQVCPGVHIEHGELPTHPVVVGLIERALGTTALAGLAGDVLC